MTREITFSAEETVKDVVVPITLDSVLEATEQFTATLSPVAGPVGILIGQGEAKATIVDDDGEIRNTDSLKHFMNRLFMS